MPRVSWLMRWRLGTVVSLAASLSGCAAGSPLGELPVPGAVEPVAIEDARDAPYVWMASALTGTCRAVPSYGLGGRAARRPQYAPTQSGAASAPSDEQ